MAYTLRPATEADREFLFSLHVLALRAYVEQTWGWDDADQRARFDAGFPLAACRIIQVDGVDAGLLVVARRPAAIELSSIEILPTFQGRGLGSAIIRDIIAEGQAAGLPVRLQVLKVNPAQRLYTRLGFAVIGETDTHIVMERPPSHD